MDGDRHEEKMVGADKIEFGKTAEDRVSWKMLYRSGRGGTISVRAVRGWQLQMVVLIQPAQVINLVLRCAFQAPYCAAFGLARR